MNSGYMSFLDGNVSTSSKPVVLGTNDKMDTNVTDKTWNPPMAMEKSPSKKP
jgi:hypothetical protein